MRQVFHNFILFLSVIYCLQFFFPYVHEDKQWYTTVEISQTRYGKIWDARLLETSISVLLDHLQYCCSEKRQAFRIRETRSTENLSKAGDDEQYDEYDTCKVETFLRCWTSVERHDYVQGSVVMKLLMLTSERYITCSTQDRFLTSL